MQLVTRGREGDPAPVAREKRYPELFFELADRTAECLLAEVQLVGRASESAGISDRQEMLQPTQIGIWPGHLVHTIDNYCL